MGHQQLLLIALSIIIVGIAVVVGIDIFTANAQQVNRDSVILDLSNIAMAAQQYIRKPIEMAGGERVFTGFIIPPKLDTTQNGKYTIQVRPLTITLIGTGVEKGKDGINNVKVTMVISPDAIVSTT